MSEEEKTRMAAQHFSLFALDGSSGAVRWQHGGGSHHHHINKEDSTGRDGRHKATENADNFDPDHHRDLDLDYPGFDGELFYDETPGAAAAAAFKGLAAAAGTAGGGGGRRYRRSLLRHLPHYWSAPADTRLEITALHRKGPGDGSGGDHAGGGGSGGTGGLGGGEEGRDRAGPGKRRSLPGASGRRGGAGWEQDGGGTTGEAAGGGAVRVVLARTREGLEAVELSTGKPLSAVALPAAGSGAGVYVDLNSDGIVDHVQARGWGEHIYILYTFCKSVGMFVSPGRVGGGGWLGNGQEREGRRKRQS